jgi:predicted alpha/beta superfamily hydrolase
VPKDAQPVVAAPVQADEDSPLGDTEVFYAASTHVDEVFKIFVGRCRTDGPDESDEPPGLLCVLDGNGFFGAAVDIVRSLQLSRHLPSLIVVGIGYRVATLAQTLPQRTRDLTPTRDERFSKVFPELADTGGADPFLAFLRGELLPWVQATYGTSAELTALFGHSLGGLFATYVLHTAPDTFSRYIIGSPSYWWNRGAAFRLEEEYAAGHTDLRARLFMGIGSDETHEGRQREAANLSDEARAITASRVLDMVEEMERMAGVLRSRSYPGLRLDTAVFPDEFHISVPTLTLSRGLRTLFDAPR